MRRLIFRAAGIVIALAGTALLLAGLLLIIAALGVVQRYVSGAVLSAAGIGLLITRSFIFREGTLVEPTNLSRKSLLH
jgi:hypothetical protein